MLSLSLSRGMHPDDPHDLLDRGGRLRRIAFAATIGAAITTLIMLGIAAASRSPGDDPVGQVIPFLLGSALFVVISKGAHDVIERFRRRAGPR